MSETAMTCAVQGCRAERLRSGSMCGVHDRVHRQEASQATNNITGLWVLGLALVFIGVSLAVSQQPRLDLLNSEESGSQLGFAIGLLVAAAGQAALLVAVIATGVRMGNRADRLNP